MNALGWVAIAAAVLLVPLPGRESLRAARLSGSPRVVRPTRLVRRADGTTDQVAAPAGGDAVDPATGSARSAEWLAGAGAAGGAIVAVVVGWRCGVALGAVVLLLVGTAATLLRGALARRRQLARERKVRDAVALLGTELEAGSRPGDALRAAADAAGPYASVLRAAANDGDGAAARLRADASFAPVGHAWELAERAGVPLSQALAGVAADLDARAASRRHVAAAVAGPQSTAGLLALMPVLGIGLGAAMGAAPLRFLAGSAAGRLTCLVGVALDVAGVLWARRLIARAERT